MMTETMMIAAVLLQFCWMLIHTMRQRNEIRNLQRRLTALGTEVGVLKAKLHPRDKHVPLPPRQPAMPEAEARTMVMASAVDLASMRAQREFSPSWI
jgi:hypothetical protein